MGNRSTTEQSNRSRQQRSNVTTPQSNNSEQQRSNVTTLQNSIFRQQRSNVTTEQCGDSSGLGKDDSDSSFNGEESLRSIDEYGESSEEGNNSTADQEKCYDPLDRTLTFVDGEDEMDFLYIGYKSLRAKMSCGHAVTPMSLTDWCRRLLDEGKCRFVCGNCDAEWSYDNVRKMALLTPEEVDEFEKKMFVNAASNFNVKECPVCKSLVVRKNLSDLSVRCSVCTVNRKTEYMFCWQCLREWKGRVPRSDRCDNEGCQSPSEILKTCEDAVFKEVKGVTGCPSRRACPTCGMLVVHDGTKCKNIGCTQCKVEFCFVCLKTTTECLKLNPESWFKVCSSGVAPRQTSIPVWQHK